MIDAVQETIEQDSEVQPLSLEQIQEILKERLLGEVTVRPGDCSGSVFCLSHDITIHVCKSETLGDRVASTLRFLAGSFMRAAFALEESEGYESSTELYAVNPCGFQIANPLNEEIEFHVLNVRDEDEAIRRVRAMLEMFNSCHPLQLPAPHRSGQIRLEHSPLDEYRFRIDGEAFPEVELRVSNKESRSEAQAEAYAFIQWLQAQAYRQAEPASPESERPAESLRIA